MLTRHDQYRPVSYHRQILDWMIYPGRMQIQTRELCYRKDNRTLYKWIV